MMRLTVLDDYQRVALTSADWSPLAGRVDIDIVRDHSADEDAVVERLAASEIVVAMRERTPLPARVLDRLPHLRLLVTTGMKNAAIDLDAARRNDIVVSGTETAASPVPELTIGMMIALTRNLLAEDAAVRTGAWQHTVGPGLLGSTLGVLGLGRLGVPVAALAQALGMTVLAWSPHLTAERAAEHGVRAVTKAELFATSDVVTIHLPLSDRSRGLVGAPELALMKPTAYLVNTSRGPIVDEPALVAALRERRIAGAGLDVFDVEPLPPEHPLRSMPNTLVLPHIGYVTIGAYREWFGQVVADVVAWLDGAPVRVLT